MIQSVDRAFRILELLASQPSAIALGDIAERTRLPTPTAHRILQTLVELGYAAHLPDGRYAHGSRLLATAGKALTSIDRASRARPALRTLEQHTDETIHFGVRAGNSVQYLDKIESRRPYRLDSVVGMLIPLHCTAIGKSILAFLPDASLRTYLADSVLERRTARTADTPERLCSDLALVRARGFAIDDEEDRVGVRCVGAPVFDHMAAVIGGISVSAPAGQFAQANAEELAPAVMATAAAVSIALGAPRSIVPAAHRRALDEFGMGKRRE